MKNFFIGLKRQWKYIAAGAMFGGLALFSIYVATGTRAYVLSHRAQEACRSQYPLTSRTLGCVTFDSNSDTLHALDAMLDTATALYEKEGKAKRVSIFVRDLVSQQWAASNENEVYAPASLMKLPLLISYYKIAELDPSIFSSVIAYTSNSSAAGSQTMQDFVPANPLALGRSYTVSQLLQQMIINSDNAAADLLYAHINPDIFNQTTIDLGVRLPVNQTTIDFVTVKTYAGIIRMLYNSAYLNRDSSEEVLTLMTKTAFKGIADPLPAGVLVAHKFGERENDARDGAPVTRELHDCGIVYKTPDPYIICIMTEGSNFDDLLAILSNLSNLVYQNM